MKLKILASAIVLALAITTIAVQLAFAEHKVSGNVHGETSLDGSWYYGETWSNQAWPFISSATRLWHYGIDSSSTTSSLYNSTTSGLSGASGIIWGPVVTQHTANAPTGGYLLYTSGGGSTSTANWWNCGKASCP